MLKVGVVGCGYWGPNLIRNFFNLSGTEVKSCADISENRLKHMKNLYPSMETTTDYKDIVEDPDIDAIIVATPVSSHFEIALAALDAGKHVFVE
ncbi:MAG: Gfo/Idh/MocA family oxidoreductase, partial [Candidatus Krumholzibacteria bacterium]|nr:Gfo/Idh/MocA family oxidoreductase [Candidatus Krumholzibacteria bacterium]